jgi:hypothetical protein
MAISSFPILKIQMQRSLWGEVFWRNQNTEKETPKGAKKTLRIKKCVTKDNT